MRHALQIVNWIRLFKVNIVLQTDANLSKTTVSILFIIIIYETTKKAINMLHFGLFYLYFKAVEQWY
jgi:hypothetical protein